MGKIYDYLSQDVRFIEGLNACINCGTCTAICPAAAFYDYDPRRIAVITQSKNEDEIIELLKSDTIWYCGECMSCATRCPRGNKPGLIIIALRSLSQKKGYFVESEKGRQQLAIKRMVGESILETGYCVYAGHLNTLAFPEQGPIWDWIINNPGEVYKRLGGNYNGNGGGLLRKIPAESLEELKSIFDISGASEQFNNIEKTSKKKADELGIPFGTGKECEYFKYVYTGERNRISGDKEP